MALFNYATRELSAKVVYYGPGLSGKTTNIEMVHHILQPDQKGRLISLPTETDRTLFFDFLPVDLGLLKGFKVRFHLYTVPGQVFYNATRRLVLQGVDGVVFVADSQKDMAQSNVESLKNLTENLATYGKRLDELPFVLQYNKRDLKNVSSVQEMDKLLNPMNVPVLEGIAKSGVGVSETLVTISRMVFTHLRKTLLMPGETAEEDLGSLADQRIRESFGRKEPEPLEEISEIEMIQEEPDLRPPEAPPLLHEVVADPAPPPPEAVADPEPPLAAASTVPDEIEILRSTDLRGEPNVPAAPASDEIEIEIPEPVPAAAAPAPVSDEIEIEIPEPVPAAPKNIRAGVSLEQGDGTLTFLKFENPHLAPEGHAVLPAVLMDGNGNIVRVRLRISIEE